MVNCIINVAKGDGYVRIQKRMEKSLRKHGYTGDILLWQDWCNRIFPTDNIYNVKPSALFETILRGYRRILWLDASIYATNDIQPIWDIISERGYYAWKNGYNCAQECNDKSLSYFNISRDEAESMPMCASGVFGVDLDTEIGQLVAREWMQSALDGIFEGRRNDNKIESQDERFMHHRQDQSALSLILNKHGLKMFGGEHVAYDAEEFGSHILGIKGI